VHFLITTSRRAAAVRRRLMVYLSPPDCKAMLHASIGLHAHAPDDYVAYVANLTLTLMAVNSLRTFASIEWHWAVWNAHRSWFYQKLIRRWDRPTLRVNYNYRLNHAMIVKLYQPYTQFSRNVRLSHRRNVLFWLNWLFWLLRHEFLLDNYLWQFYLKHLQTTWCDFVRRHRML